MPAPTPLGPWLGRLAAGLGQALRHRLLEERDRWPLWLPVGLGLGIALFFALPGQPPWPVPALAGALGLLAAILARRSGDGLRRVTAAALAALCLGFALAELRLLASEAPVLARGGSYRIEGRIEELEPRGAGSRLLLGELRLDRQPPERTPRLARITVRQDAGELAVGERIAVRARLEAPAGPPLPGGFDYARQAWFEQLGAVGYAMGKATALRAPEPASGLQPRIARLRAAIARRLTGRLPGATGAMAAALLTGVRAAIDDRTWRAMQISGLAHLISISGLHMALVAGTVFGTARYGLALLPWLALRVRVHKPAALLAFAAVSFYVLLSGASVPAERSYLMIAVALLAVLLDRNPFSLRMLAWAALAVLLLRPESILGASFQLSFAAVLALMAVYERVHLGAVHGEVAPGLLGRVLAYVLGVAFTSLIAGGATTPFAAFHFQTIATYGMLSNLVAVPLTSFLVMPAGMLGLLLMPFGLDAPVFRLMGRGVDAVLETAHLAAALPGASISVGQWPLAALLGFSLGGLWLALWRKPWRRWGLLPCALALLLVLLGPRPVLLVDARLDMALRMALRPDREALLLEWQGDARRREGWAKALAQPPLLRVREPVQGRWEGAACDAQACRLDLEGRIVSLSRSAEAAIEDCAIADLVIATAGPERCAGRARLIGPAALRASGGLALRAGPHGLEVETIAGWRGHWPWVP